MTTRLMRFFLLIGLLVIGQMAHGQNKKRKSKSRGGEMTEDQWWIGFKGGFNSTSISEGDKYAVFSPTGKLSSTSNDKKYENISKYGSQIGIIVAYEFINNLSLSLQPETTSYKFGYKNEYQWLDFEDTDNTLTLKMTHDHTLRYFEVPLLLRYDFHLGGGSENKKPKNRYESSSFPIIPYIQAGAFYGKLLSASKSIHISGVDNFSGAKNELDQVDQREDLEPLLLSANWGVVGGVGISHKISNARISLEANYKLGMVNVTDASERFRRYSLVTGAYDALDDIKLRNLEISFRFIMPLKFITSRHYNAL